MTNVVPNASGVGYRRDWRAPPASDFWKNTVALQRDARRYDGSDIEVCLVYSLSAVAGGGQAVRIDYSWAFYEVGGGVDPSAQVDGSAFDLLTVGGEGPSDVYEQALTDIPGGVVGAAALGLTIGRATVSSVGDTFPGTFRVIAVETRAKFP